MRLPWKFFAGLDYQRDLVKIQQNIFKRGRGMRTSNLSLALLSTSCLLLAGCETTAPPEKLEINLPECYLEGKKDTLPQVTRAFSLLKAGKYSEASSFINQTLQTQPKNVIFHILNGLTYEKLAENGDPTGQDLAIMGYEKALQIDPFNHFAMTQLGKLKYRNQKFEEAQEHFANALLVKPNDLRLMHDFAAASYYAYDIKKALPAIRKAVELKPDDPFLQRNASMMYAAVGDFENAEKHFKIFQKITGQNIDVTYVANRFKEWQQLYRNGKFKLAAGPGGSATTTGDLVDLPNSGAFPGGPGGPVAVTVAPEVESEPVQHQIVIDAYMVEIHEDALSSKGNNILTNLAVTLNPGSYVRFNGEASGSGLLPAHPTNNPATQVTADAGSATGAGAVLDSAGKLLGTVNPSSIKTTLSNAGNFSGYLFTRGISWAGLSTA